MQEKNEVFISCFAEAQQLYSYLAWDRRNNDANESQNSPLEKYKVIFRRSTPKGGGGLNLIIAECSPLKTKSVPEGGRWIQNAVRQRGL